MLMAEVSGAAESGGGTGRHAHMVIRVNLEGAGRRGHHHQYAVVTCHVFCLAVVGQGRKPHVWVSTRDMPSISPSLARKSFSGEKSFPSHSPNFSASTAMMTCDGSARRLRVLGQRSRPPGFWGWTRGVSVWVLCLGIVGRVCARSAGTGGRSTRGEGVQRALRVLG